MRIKEDEVFGPSFCGSAGWATSCKLKGHLFDSPEHMLGLWFSPGWEHVLKGTD